jgi:beta-lactamase class D
MKVVIAVEATLPRPWNKPRIGLVLAAMRRPPLPATARLTALLAAVLTSACARPSPTAPESSEPASPSANQPERLEPTPAPALAARLHEAGYTGAFVVFDPARERLFVSDPELAERRLLPASTFKILNSLIALETGVADGPGFTLAWDGVDRGGAEWNQDLDLATAFRVSAVWYYQELARRIGPERMAEYVRAAEYGNADSSGPVDGFWLAGPLAISAREQVELLARLERWRADASGPFSPATVATFLDEVMVERRDSTAVIRAKTGWGRSQDLRDPARAGFQGHVGWYVGSRERAGARVYFALVLLSPDPAPPNFDDDRRTLAMALLDQVDTRP